MPTRKKYSPLWNHFNQIEPKRAKCLYCSRTLAITKSSIGSLSRHMKSVHPKIKINSTRKKRIKTEEPTVAETEAEESAAISYILMDSAARSANTDHILEKKLVRLKRNQELDEQLVRMIAKGYHAINIVDEVDFRKFVEKLNPGYTLPTRKILSESVLPRVYGKMVEAAREQLKQATAICVTTDGWTSITGNGYLAITAHFINQETDKACNVMIGCIDYQEQHTSENLRDFFNEQFREWGIDGHVSVIVSDNAADMLAAVRIGGWQSISCFAHNLNLVVEESLDAISETVSRVKSTVEYFHSSFQGASKLIEIQNTMGIESLKLKQAVTTRWNSTYEMLDRMFQMKDAVVFTLAVVRPDLSLPDTDWDVMEQALPILQTFYEVTIDLSGENYVSASMYIVYCKLIERKLETYKNNATQYGKTVYDLINRAKTEMKHRFAAVESNVLLSEATILDPRFKKNGFVDIGQYEKAASALRNKIGRVTLPTENSSSPSPRNYKTETEQRVIATSANSFWNDFDEEVAHEIPHNPTVAGIVEFDTYINEPLIKRNENPLKWWKERRSVYPRLYTHMLKRLNITATSVPCERLFTKAGLTLNQRRTRLTTKKLSQLVFISSN